MNGYMYNSYSHTKHSDRARAKLFIYTKYDGGFPIDGCLTVYCAVVVLNIFPIADRKSDEF